MAIAHICLKCGEDLSYERPRREPHYGLPLIVCPYCGDNSVRQRHPIQQRWRQIKRLLTTLWVLALQLALLVPFVGTVVSIVLFLEEIQRDAGMDRLIEIYPYELLLCALGALASGVWLSFAFGHWKRYTQWIGWVALLVVLIVVFHVVLVGVDHRVASLRELFGALRVDMYLLGRRMITLGMVLVLSAAAMPLQRPGLAVYGQYRRSRWRKRLNRARRKRHV